MSALRDNTQPIRFYYGNAALDLNDMLPPDEAPTTQTASQNDGNVLGQIRGLLARANDRMDEIERNRRQIHFLLSDVKRMVG